ncbi:quinone-dependent dihydroorotate dehydrogenase [Pseudanabaena mucicola]|uniref:Dihydroorotate dehydrogenase (quinone) n=1 Tax=Pseudanabaena mucicola FACHB-723 TaxID=2692860 RepID=A0ABR8A0N6_9CYAN|nr:quinone-dependent dihydroorotate dehydrogenase [Pseudanabaena mucicola]MBD2189399.1 quinone-dependent dihydroorotate dehydrogenase [Pseudanabaena mucicola FACHB-723]
MPINPLSIAPLLSVGYKYGMRPLLFALDPEVSHNFAIATCRRISESPQLQAIAKSTFYYSDSRLSQTLWNLKFENPVGLAAGFDKNAEAIGAWSNLGFGFAEVGTITALAQSGNPKPRLFRLPSDLAVLNRMGFNNNGAVATAANLKQYLQNHQLTVPLGINLGKSKVTAIADAKLDYADSLRSLYEFGDYFVVNVSSPNTPNLRDLQATDQLCGILAELQPINRDNKPIFVKIAPDLNDADIIEVVKASQNYGVAGIIATNTTISRQNLVTTHLSLTGQPVATEMGGISGQPVRDRSLAVIKLIWQTTEGKLPIIGVGGIFTAEDAWQKITAGASLVQVYTGLIYEGPMMISQILQGLVSKLESHGLANIQSAIGLSHR